MWRSSAALAATRPTGAWAPTSGPHTSLSHAERAGPTCVRSPPTHERRPRRVGRRPRRRLLRERQSADSVVRVSRSCSRVLGAGPSSIVAQSRPVLAGTRIEPTRRTVPSKRTTPVLPDVPPTPNPLDGEHRERVRIEGSKTSALRDPGRDELSVWESGDRRVTHSYHAPCPRYRGWGSSGAPRQALRTRAQCCRVRQHAVGVVVESSSVPVTRWSRRPQPSG